MKNKQTHSIKDIFSQVASFWVENIKHVELNKQFHFYSRVYLWSNRTLFVNELKSIRPEWDPGNEQLSNDIRSIYTMSDSEHLANLEKIPKYKTIFYKKYPHISLYNKLFFKIFFNEVIFGYVDADVIGAFDRTHVQQLYKVLTADNEAVHVLSTGAVNFIYLIRHIFPELPMQDETTLFDLWSSSYLDPAPPQSPEKLKQYLHVTIYGLTHIIINEAKFYSDKEAVLAKKSTLLPLLQYAERLILEHYDKVNLDKKFEFVVCARLLHYVSVLEMRVQEEASDSISPLGNYFVNTHNIDAQSSRNRKFSEVEHSNVLALMAYWY